jgi:cysteine desulfurase
MRRVYLDHTATTPLDPRVFEAMKPYFLEKFGNASSIHQFGQEARAALDESRAVIAGLIGAKEGEIYFTGSGTEADNFALKGIAVAMRKRGKSHIITSKAEHHAVLETCEFLEQEGFDVTYLNVDEYGMVEPETVRSAITDKTGLVSIMHANNEVGTINPIAEIAPIARQHRVVFHTDAVQTFSKVPLNVSVLSVDLLSISAHKIYGPKGIGALYIRKGVEIEKFIHGGGQERGRRASTEAVPLAVGFAKAAQLMQETMESEGVRLAVLKDRLRTMLEERFPFLVFNGHPTRSLPHILNVSFDSSKIDVQGDVLLLNLDLAGIAVTSGSACTSGSMKPSHVLLATGRDVKTAQATIRFSMGRSTSLEDIEYTVGALEKILKKVAKTQGSPVRGVA